MQLVLHAAAGAAGAAVGLAAVLAVAWAALPGRATA